MSLILPSVSAPPSSSSQPTQASARNEAPDPNSSESFGAVLSRSLAPAGEAAGKPEAKSTTAAAARRPAEGRKAEPDELLNAMALPLIPPETLLPKALAAGTAAAAAGEGPAPGLAAPALAGLPAGKTLAAAMAGEPVTGPAPAAAAEETAPPGMPVAALATALAPELQAAGQKEPGPAALPTRALAAQASPSVPLTTAAIAGPSGAPDSDGTGQSPQQRDSTRDLPQAAAETAAGNSPKPDTLQGMVKTTLAATSATDATPASAGTSLNTHVSTSGQTAIADLPAASTAAAISPASVAAAPAPAALFSANAAPVAMARSLAPEVGSGEWGKALGQQMIHMGKGGEQVAELQLNPPGLGPLKVTLSMNDQQVQAMFVSAHSSVRAAVEAALPQLRSTLADSGISLGNTSVNAESQQQTAFAQGQNGQNGQSAQRGYRAERTPDNPEPAVRPAAETSRPAGAGIRVDTYA